MYFNHSGFQHLSVHWSLWRMEFWSTAIWNLLLRVTTLSWNEKWCKYSMQYGHANKYVNNIHLVCKKGSYSQTCECGITLKFGPLYPSHSTMDWCNMKLTGWKHQQLWLVKWDSLEGY